MEETKRKSGMNSRKDVPAISASESALWGRVLDPIATDLTPEVASYIHSLRFPQSDIDRMQKLADKAREGALTFEEQIELDNYERVGQVLSLMKSKARKSLKQVRATH
jgi:uncharacterized protein YnzC (UPF0291/DUF896 family)